MSTEPTTATAVTSTSRALAPVDAACNVISSDKFKAQVATALPPGVDPDRFVRVAMTALRQTPELADADRNTLYNACLKSAADGLLPDGREGAFVVFNKKVKDAAGKEFWQKCVQWMPMIGGITKKLAQCGISLSAEVVYENDEFDYELGDNPSIRHKAPRLGVARGQAIGAYAVARTKDGMIFREVMSKEQIEHVRAASRAANSGPWVNWWDEMARKTVARRLAKRLPITDPKVAEAIQSDDELYDFERATGDGRQTAVKTGAAAAINAKIASVATVQPTARGLEQMAASDEPGQYIEGSFTSAQSHPAATQAQPLAAQSNDASDF